MEVVRKFGGALSVLSCSCQSVVLGRAALCEFVNETAVQRSKRSRK